MPVLTLHVGALQGLSLPSPYLDIVSMSQRRAPSEDTRTARLIFDHALMVCPGATVKLSDGSAELADGLLQTWR